MKLKDVILLSLAAAMVIVGIHVTITQGILMSYPILMIAMIFLFWFRFRKAKEAESKGSEQTAMKNKKKRHK